MAIVDLASGSAVLGDFGLVSGSPHASAAAAYTTWAGELGVSSTATLSTLDGDETRAALDLGFSVLQRSGADKIHFYSEGQLLLYGVATPGALSTVYSNTLSASGVTISRAYSSNAAPHAALLLCCKALNEDCTTLGGKWQKATGAAIIYYKIHRYGQQAVQVVEVAVKLTPGFIEYVTTNVNATTGRFVFFAFGVSSTPSSGVDVAGLLSGTQHFKTAAPKSVSGVVQDASASPAARKVHLYHEASSLLVGEATSSAVNGTYAISTYNTDGHTAVAYPAAGENLPALILSGVVPV